MIYHEKHILWAFLGIFAHYPNPEILKSFKCVNQLKSIIISISRIFILRSYINFILSDLITMESQRIEVTTHRGK